MYISRLILKGKNLQEKLNPNPLYQAHVCSNNKVIVLITEAWLTLKFSAIIQFGGGGECKRGDELDTRAVHGTACFTEILLLKVTQSFCEQQ